ncbi:MAG: ImmA/IrrE family metallo-endopeptidase [Planctomycetota bacterium]
MLEDLAYAMGVVVVEGRLDGADARLVRRGKRGLIRVRQDIADLGRKRFATAHELGHWVLHERVSQVLACTSEDMVRQYKASPPEMEANYFASALLMPEKLIRPQIRGKQPTFDLIKQLATSFNTSLTATAVRFVELSTEYCAVVISEAGRIRWGRASEALEDAFRLEWGAPVAPESVAAAAFRGDDTSDGPQKVDISTWLRANEAGDTELEADTICEDARLFRQYGQVLSLLWIP